MKKNLMFKAIECVMRTNEIDLNMSVSFELKHCWMHPYGDEMYRFYIIHDTEYKHSVVEYLLKWNSEEDRFMTSSEF